MEKLKSNIQRENSALRQKITQLEGDNKNLQINITEKQSFIEELKKKSKELKEKAKKNYKY